MASFRRRATAAGEVKWQAIVRLKGAPPIFQTFVSKSAAKRWASQIEGELRSGRLLPRLEAERHTLDDAIERYEADEMAELAPRSRGMREGHLAFWRGELGGRPLSSVTPAAISAARARLLRRVSPATSNRYLASLSSVLRLCEREWQWIDANPCRRVRRKPESRGRVRFLSTEEREALLEACEPDPRLQALVLCALASGARQGELMELKWGDVDLVERRAVLHETKNSDRRVITFAGRAGELLEQLPRQISGYVFGPRFPRKRWEKALAAAELEDFRFHDLRHTAASYLAMSGASVPEIAAFLGHRSFQLAARYAHLTSQHSAERAEQMAEKFLA